MGQATPCHLGLAVAVLFLFVVPSAGTQPVFGATSKIGAPLLIRPSSLLDSKLDWQMSYAPSLTVDSEYYRFQATGELSYDTSQPSPSFELDRFELAAYPTHFLSLRLGRFPYLPGKADLLSQTNFFARLDEEALICGDLADAVVPTDLLQMELYASDVYLKLTAEPLPKPILLPDPSSPWFPKKDLPAELSFTFPFRRTLTLGELNVEPTPGEPFTVSNVSVSAEAGGTLSIFDGAVMYFHGRDYNPILSSRLELPSNLSGSYNISLIPVYPVIDAFGLDLSATFWRIRAWLDSSYTLKKTYSTRQLSTQDFTTTTATSPSLAYTVGASLTTDKPSATFSLQYSGGKRFTEIPAVVEPLFSSILAGSARLSLLQDRFGLAAIAIVSARDWSAVQMYSVSFNPSQELGMSVTLPLFTGAPTTDFGQFSGNYQLATTLTWRF